MQLSAYVIWPLHVVKNYHSRVALCGLHCSNLWGRKAGRKEAGDEKVLRGRLLGRVISYRYRGHDMENMLL